MKALTGCLDVWDQTNSFFYSALFLTFVFVIKLIHFSFMVSGGEKCHGSQGFRLPNKLFTFIFSGTSVLA